MDNAIQNKKPSENILQSQIQKTSKHKGSIDYLNIIFIVALVLSISSTAVLAYQSYSRNLVISLYGLQDYFYGNNDSVTLKKILRIPDVNTNTDTVTTKEALALRIQQIQDEAISAANEAIALRAQQIRDEAIITADEKSLAEINDSTTAAALSYGVVETNDLDNLISFIVPKNFSKISVIDEINKPAISIKSADFKYTADLNFASGVYINIYKKNVDSTYQIGDEDNETNRKYLQDFKFTTIGGKPAAYGFLEFETYSERYFILNNSERWSIYIGYGGNTLQEALSYKAKYKNEIDQFINSISFK